MHWNLKNFILKPGIHEIYLGLHINSYIENIEDLVKINLIEISGVFHPSFECTPCKYGFSGLGSSKCSRCEANQYLNSMKDSECQHCPNGKYAPPGSIGSQSCILKPHCSIYDYINKDAECKEGLKSINKQPIPDDGFCTDNKESQTGLSFPCGECNPGYVKYQGECKPCSYGNYSNGTSSCFICPPNTYSNSVIFLKYFDKIPDFIKNYCFNHDPNIDACSLYDDGWAIINNSFVATPNLLNLVTLNLEINFAIFQDEGQFEFIYESNCSNNSFLYVKNKSYIFYIYLTNSSSFIMPLKKGNHTIIISYFTLNTFSFCTVKIYNIRISGVVNGVSDSCNECPDGSFSLEGSNFCTRCPEGQARLGSNICQECPENFYRDRNMNECHKCASHTIPNDDRTGCELYDAYEINDKYMFNIFKFDVNEDFSKYSSSKYFSTGGFFGPIFFDDNESIFYLSPTIPRRFSSYFYEFEEELDFNNEDSYVFALLHINVSEQRIYNQKNIKAQKNSSHYRALRSFGTEIGKVKLNQLGNIIASVTYINGDKCHENPQLNYTSTINFVCDKSANHFSPKISTFKNCHMDILWKSPFACS